jgi:hypothetical protein
MEHQPFQGLRARKRREIPQAGVVRGELLEVQAGQGRKIGYGRPADVEGAKARHVRERTEARNGRRPDDGQVAQRAQAVDAVEGSHTFEKQTLYLGRVRRRQSRARFRAR